MGKNDVEKALQNFISRLKYASHILPLLENENITVLFCPFEDNEITLVLNGNDVSLNNRNGHDGYALTIRGDSTTLIELIEGREKLQTLKKRGELAVEGKFRYILKVESILYCCSFELSKS
ncbi:MAG TPA: SCP2 sterol-binding domain-containing protein [Bacillus bacterium]|nr:SCP2 sterol-binding domain-containing protein [Bacillus sp. (in: firmicutes)]